jgi:serine/threonine protein phosphatase PrpC
MAKLSPLRGLVAGSTISAKPVNQDAFCVVRNEKVPLAAAIVADGLGSHFGAEIASSIAAATIAAGLDKLTTAAQLDLHGLFCEASRAIAQYRTEHADSLPPNLDWQNAFGTTAVCAVETDHELLLAYIGNGGIFHIRGNFNTFPKSQLLPWTAVNYLNPHALPRDGKNVIYQVLSPYGSGGATAPTILTLTKDDELLGDIILICTDGVYSFDQVPMGRDSDRKVWISAEPSTTLFFEALDCFFTGPTSQDRLNRCVETYLTNLKAANLVCDDCTVGVLITEKALEFQDHLKTTKTEGGER